MEQERIAIVCDGNYWHVRHIALIEHDLDADHKVYRCDQPISSDHDTLSDVPQVRELLKASSTANKLLIELRCATIQHCHSLQAVTEFLGDDNKPAAIARIDQAVSALLATVRGQCSGQTIACPSCGAAQGLVAWVEEGTCANCGEMLNL